MIFIYALAILHMAFNPMNWIPMVADNGKIIFTTECIWTVKGFYYQGDDGLVGHSTKTCIKAYDRWSNEHFGTGLTYGNHYVPNAPLGDI